MHIQRCQEVVETGGWACFHENWSARTDHQINGNCLWNALKVCVQCFYAHAMIITYSPAKPRHVAHDLLPLAGAFPIV